MVMGLENWLHSTAEEQKTQINKERKGHKESRRMELEVGGCYPCDNRSVYFFDDVIHLEEFGSD